MSKPITGCRGSYFIVSPESHHKLLGKHELTYRYPSGYTIKLKMEADMNVGANLAYVIAKGKYIGCFNIRDMLEERKTDA